MLDELEALSLATASQASACAGAPSVDCSRRTIDQMAPSTDELVLIVLDRFLHRVGRAALDAIDPARSYADQITEHFRGGIELQRLTGVFGDDLADDAAARPPLDRHHGLVTAVTEQLVAEGVESGDDRPVLAPIVAGVLAGTGVLGNQPDVRPTPAPTRRGRSQVCSSSPCHPCVTNATAVGSDVVRGRRVPSRRCPSVPSAPR